MHHEAAMHSRYSYDLLCSLMWTIILLCLVTYQVYPAILSSSKVLYFDISVLQTNPVNCISDNCIICFNA